MKKEEEEEDNLLLNLTSSFLDRGFEKILNILIVKTKKQPVEHPSRSNSLLLCHKGLKHFQENTLHCRVVSNFNPP